MLKILGVFGTYFVQALKGRMAYKTDFFALLLASILVTLSGLLFVVVLVDGEVVTSIGGWKRDELLVIYAVSSIATALFSIFAINLYNFGDRFIVQGQFDRVLLRPINTLAQVLIESFNLESLGSLLVGLILLFTSCSRLGISLGLGDYLWLLVSSLSGAVIILSVFIVLASINFHVDDRLGVSAPVYNLLTFGRYPLPIFNYFIQILLSWIFPFAFAGFYPATLFLERREYLVYCYASPLVALVSFVLANWAWSLGVAHYKSTGH